MACEYCKGEGTLYQTSRNAKVYMGSFGNNRTIEFESNICPPHTDCFVKSIKQRACFKINYCPNCGEKMTDDETNTEVEKLKSALVKVRAICRQHLTCHDCLISDGTIRKDIYGCPLKWKAKEENEVFFPEDWKIDRWEG